MPLPSYKYYTEVPLASPLRRTRPSVRTERNTVRRPDISVLQGNKRAVATQVPANFSTLIKVAIAFVLIFSVLGIARVCISSHALASSIETKQINADIENARSQTASLEVKASVLASSSVKEKAQELGMEAAEYTSAVTLEEDVVAQDSSGNIVLSESIRRASNSQG